MYLAQKFSKPSVRSRIAQEEQQILLILNLLGCFMELMLVNWQIQMKNTKK